jgi:rhodanese-related sulfurtransferase
LYPRKSKSAAAVRVRAEVSFVDGDEAKRLVAEEGYTVLDIRDGTQRERAHIKASTHVPLFVENQDNDIGMYVCKMRRRNHGAVSSHAPHAVS